MFSNLVAFVPMLGAVAVFCAYLMLCGGLIAWALRARGFAFFTVAIPAGFAAIAVAQVGTHFIKLPWSPLLPLGVSIVTALLLGVAASFFAKKAPKPEKQTLQKWLQGIIAVIVLAAIYAITFVRALKEPTVISQTFDGNFHLNLADVFAARGSVDPFSVDLSSPGSNKFYPSLWHACVVLIMQMSGLTVDVATNALTIVAASLVWSTGMIALVRLLLGNKKIVQVAAVLGCIAMVQMPFIPVQWGTLYANMLGLCLTPYILCGVLYLFKLTRKDTDPLSIFAAFFLTFGALGAAVLAHPTAIFPPLILTAILILRNALKTWKNTEYTSRQKLFAWGLVVLITIVSAIIWYKTKNEVTWKPHLTYNAAFSNGFSGSTGFTVTDWLTGFTALFGTYLTFRNKQLRWLTVLYVSFVGLWIITASFKSGLLRSALSAPWYADHWRLAMQVPLVSVVLSAIAITFIGHKILAQTPKIKARFGSFVARLFPTGVTLATGILLLNSVGYAQATQNTTDVFRATPEAAPLLSLNERDVLLHLDKVAQKGDKVAGNPWTGTALATAFTKADALFPHLLGDYSEDYYELAEKIATGAGKACKIAAELQVKYVLDFGDKQVLQSWLERDFYGPIVNLDKKDTPALTKIYSKGNARLYEITGCKN